MLFKFFRRALKKNTRFDVLKKDFDVFVAVAAVLFMMEPESVKELVLNSTVRDTSRTLERNNLSSTLAPQIWIATVDHT